MSTKFMKVYICDYCGKIKKPRVAFDGFDLFKMAPKHWIHTCKMDLCPTCGENFTKAMEGKNNESISE